MEIKRNRNELKLLPRYFKIIGLVIVVLAFIPIAVIAATDLSLTHNQKEYGKLVTFGTLTLGLFFIAFSKDKIEDEMIMLIRLKAMAAAFIAMVVMVFIKPFLDLLFKYPMADYHGQEIVENMLLFYLMMYYLQKRRR